MKISDEQVEAVAAYLAESEDTGSLETARHALEIAYALIPEPEYEYGLEDITEPTETVWFPLGLEHQHAKRLRLEAMGITEAE